MNAPRVWSVDDIVTVARFSGASVEVAEKIRRVAEFCESLPGADVEATCAFGTAHVSGSGSAE